MPIGLLMSAKKSFCNRVEGLECIIISDRDGVQLVEGQLWKHASGGMINSRVYTRVVCRPAL